MAYNTTTKKRLFQCLPSCKRYCRRPIGWKHKTTGFAWNLPTTVGSKSTKTARGTCFPAPVSLKKVLKESSPPPMVLSLGIWPSGWIPCSKQYNSQQALPICTPAWPTWTEIHSRWKKQKQSRKISPKLSHLQFTEWNRSAARQTFNSRKNCSTKI